LLPKTARPSEDGRQAFLQQGVDASLWNEKSPAAVNIKLPAKQGDQDAEDALFRKITWRLMPLLFTSYLFAFLDRINVGYAQLQMKTMPGFSDSVYGFGAGLFFISYILFQIPSNIWLQRLGARLTLGRIMILWGLTSAGTMFVRTPHDFYIARFLLGMFESGLFPGIIWYLVYWFPPKRRATVTSWFMLAIPVAGLLGGPFSGWVMSFFNMKAHLAGWQWMLLLEGLPASMSGLIFVFSCADIPCKADWLTTSERVLLEKALSGSESESKRLGIMDDKFRLICDLRLWGLAFVYFAAACGNYT
jgi:MFS family permease